MSKVKKKKKEKKEKKKRKEKGVNSISNECKVKYFLTMIDVTAPLLTREEAHSLTPVLKEGKKNKNYKSNKKKHFYIYNYSTRG